mmetsp:Transcript_6106/g.12057  ORF Transcript_6106/g.12057 Transcript_6106/m.12057 type:complete len:204 (-) Transcript_6106:94-705(-)
MTCGWISCTYSSQGCHSLYTLLGGIVPVTYAFHTGIPRSSSYGSPIRASTVKKSSQFTVCPSCPSGIGARIMVAPPSRRPLRLTSYSWSTTCSMRSSCARQRSIASTAAILRLFKCRISPETCESNSAQSGSPSDGTDPFPSSPFVPASIPSPSKRGGRASMAPQPGARGGDSASVEEQVSDSERYSVLPFAAAMSVNTCNQR